MMALGQMEMLKMRVPSENKDLTKEVIIEYMKFLIETYPTICLLYTSDAADE